MFAGLFPGRGNIQPPLGLDPLHASFASFSASVKGSFHQDPNQNDDEDEEDDLETSDRKALDEWHAIRAAFDLFERSLGEDFAPLSEDMHVPRESPFGTAYVYRTYGIAGIWMNFYMGLITLHRSHPSMPPFPMRAAHMVQQQTEPFATKIGKIVAGVAEDWAAESMVSTMVGAVFIECCFPLFVAAVQVRYSFPPIFDPHFCLFFFPQWLLLNIVFSSCSFEIASNGNGPSDVSTTLPASLGGKQATRLPMGAKQHGVKRLR